MAPSGECLRGDCPGLTDWIVSSLAPLYWHLAAYSPVLNLVLLLSCMAVCGPR